LDVVCDRIKEKDFILPIIGEEGFVKYMVEMMVGLFLTNSRCFETHELIDVGTKWCHLPILGGGCFMTSSFLEKDDCR